jgi:environmental stress-induced protein Ves
MKKTLITRDQFKITPWKSGAGVTAEIDIAPPGADFRENNFEWRISSAHIADENKFSQFPGYDRILTVLSGQGLLLNNQELGPFEIFEFEGEEQIDCALIENQVEDLNLIFKRGKYRCSMQIITVTDPMDLKLDPGIHFFLTLSSPASISDIELQAPNFLKIEGQGGIDISAENYPTHLLKIEITERSLN